MNHLSIQVNGLGNLVELPTGNDPFSQMTQNLYAQMYGGGSAPTAPAGTPTSTAGTSAQQPMVMPTMDLTDGAPATAKKTSVLVYLGLGALLIGGYLMLRGNKRPALAGLGCSGGRGLGCPGAPASALGALWRKGGIDRVNRPWYMVVPVDARGHLRETKIQVGTLADTLKAAKVMARKTGHDIEVRSRTSSGRASSEKFTVGPE